MNTRHIRRSAAVLAAAGTAGALLVGCGPDARGTGAPAGTASSSPSAASHSPDAGSTTPTAAPAGATSAAPASTAPPATGDTAPCTDSDVSVAPAQGAEIRPSGTGTGAVVVAVTNTSGRACTLRGFPTVAGAGNGSPDRNAPLTVTRSGTPAPVRLAPGHHAWVKLTFVQVQGEADGYCVSGATPTVYPTLVLGLPGAGRHQIGMADGSSFAECDNTVKVTALSAGKPA